MPYRRFSSRRRRSYGNQRRQGGTGATFSGPQNIIRHANTKNATIQSGYTQAFDLVTYNPTNHGTPIASDGSSAKVLTNNFTADGSRVDYVTMQLTIKQTDTSKNNTVYLGLISTSFNTGRLNDALMKTNFGNAPTTAGGGPFSFVTSTADGEMGVKSTEISYNLTNYSLNDIQQHNIRGLLKRQMQLYSGRVITANSTIPLPRRNRRQQEGSLFALVVMNDSESASAGSDVEIRLDTFFKEIPSNSI
jgi:hypothetical protein